MSGKLIIDPSRQLAARKATKRMLDRFYLVHSFYFRGTISHRILMDGEYYDVRGSQLAQIKAGLSAKDLMLDPVIDAEE
jgi:hypothetical protein